MLDLDSCFWEWHLRLVLCLHTIIFHALKKIPQHSAECHSAECGILKTIPLISDHSSLCHSNDLAVLGPRGWPHHRGWTGLNAIKTFFPFITEAPGKKARVFALGILKVEVSLYH